MCMCVCGWVGEKRSSECVFVWVCECVRPKLLEPDGVLGLCMDGVKRLWAEVSPAAEARGLQEARWLPAGTGHKPMNGAGTGRPCCRCVCGKGPVGLDARGRAGFSSLIRALERERARFDPTMLSAFGVWTCPWVLGAARCCKGIAGGTDPSRSVVRVGSWRSGRGHTLSLSDEADTGRET